MRFRQNFDYWCSKTHVCLGKSYSPSLILVDQGQFFGRGSSLGSFHEVASQGTWWEGISGGSHVCTHVSKWAVTECINKNKSTLSLKGMYFRVSASQLLSFLSNLIPKASGGVDLRVITSASRKDWIQAWVYFWFAVDDTQHTLPHCIMLDLDKQGVKMCSKGTYVKIGVLWRESSHEKHPCQFSLFHVYAEVSSAWMAGRIETASYQSLFDLICLPSIWFNTQVHT